MYQSIMKYIFRYVEKVGSSRFCRSQLYAHPLNGRSIILQERQAESIIEKLCQRFRIVTDERQWRDIAFCMSLLPFKSEKSVKKLVEVSCSSWASPFLVSTF